MEEKISKKFSDEHYQIFHVLFGFRILAYLTVVIGLLPAVKVPQRPTFLVISGFLVGYNLLLHFFRARVLYFIAARPGFYAIDIIISVFPLFFDSTSIAYNFYLAGTTVIPALLYKKKGYVFTAVILSFFQFITLVTSKSFYLSPINIFNVAIMTSTPFLIGYIAFHTSGLVEETISQRKIIKEQAQAQAIIKERQRIARDMHDNVTQILSGIKLRTEDLQENCDPAIACEVSTISNASREGLQALRSALFSLREDMFENKLNEVLAKYCRELHSNIGFRVETDFAGEPGLSQTTKAELFRICQEALQNINKHSGSQEAHISLSLDGQGFLIQIKDTGRGFDVSKMQQKGLGLTSMQERASSVGADLNINSSPNGGTLVKVFLPN